MIRNIIFDFGKVLVDYDYEPFLESFIEKEEDRIKFAEVVCTPEFVLMCDRGDVSFEELIKMTQAKHPEWHRELQIFYDRQMDAMTVEMPGMRDLLTRLRARGYKLYGLTNWSLFVYKVIKKYDILQMLDGRIISSEEHMIKPDKEIYDRICERFGLMADECVFTDDRVINVEGARKAGMKAITFHNAAQFEAELEEYLR
ncbi:MAG: HAD family phosphatase [Bacteroidales bacterium]|nr:HAD family phosphatase [Candidatus Cryptobacteroides onthequi]